MNKFAKGTVAAAAATLLLLGGAGTLAYWNDSVSFQGGNVTAGNLALKAGEGKWDPQIKLWVPGDASSYVVDLTLTATGDHIQGEIAMDKTTVDISPVEATSQFTVNVAPAGTLPSGVAFDSGTQKFTFTGEQNGVTIPVKVTVEFPFVKSAAQNDSKNATVDLKGIKFVATQTAATGAVTTP